ncbi:MAG: hypothetical protein KatS3mg103_0257 [Phycisphaerales bacterium]|nr:MAG: hypothetical protein KatS3mg103_0257 [Phycisphaerales bacterium]
MTCRWAALAWAIAACLVAGCSMGQPNASPKGGSLRDEGQELFAPDSAQAQGKWTIVLAAFRGEDAPAAARLVQDTLRRQAGLTGTSLEQRGQAVLLTLGRFDGPEAPRAQAELRRVHALELNGTRPFAQALLTPPEPPSGSMPAYDLRNAPPGYAYTLQIGSYGRDDGRPPSEADRALARRAAEQAVAVLRSEGEAAFYFHGPNFSSVTVGLFRQDEIDPRTGHMSEAYSRLKEKFPYNLFNGAQRLVKLPGSAEPQPQRSVLVRIPR